MSRAKKTLLTVIEAVAGVLGNTRAVCRKSYIHPVVIDSFMPGALTRRPGVAGGRKGPRGVTRGLRPEELAVVSLLKRAAVKASDDRRRERGRAA
jgi:DNA topoisomerase-1